MGKPIASLSLDLDNKWSYLKTHGEAGWETFPTYLPLVVPRVLQFLRQRGLTITFFIVGQDAALPENRAALRAIADDGHEIGNHSFRHEPWLHLYSEDEIDAELARAEEAIAAATDRRPVGFRGPGLALSHVPLPLGLAGIFMLVEEPRSILMHLGGLVVNRCRILMSLDVPALMLLVQALPVGFAHSPSLSCNAAEMV